tara:strand:+ start:1453 stop:1656 length:204 start_codon:yes stop_codon:yes gene_type:complete
MHVIGTISGITDYGWHVLEGGDTSGWTTACGIKVAFTTYGTNLIDEMRPGYPTCQRCIREMSGCNEN